MIADQLTGDSVARSDDSQLYELSWQLPWVTVTIVSRPKFEPGTSGM